MLFVQSTVSIAHFPPAWIFTIISPFIPSLILFFVHISARVPSCCSSSSATGAGRNRKAPSDHGKSSTPRGWVGLFVCWFLSSPPPRTFHRLLICSSSSRLSFPPACCNPFVVLSVFSFMFCPVGFSFARNLPSQLSDSFILNIPSSSHSFFGVCSLFRPFFLFVNVLSFPVPGPQTPAPDSTSPVLAIVSSQLDSVMFPSIAGIYAVLVLFAPLIDHIRQTMRKHQRGSGRSSFC